MSQVVENALSHNVERSCQKIPGSGSGVLQNLISSLSTGKSVANCLEDPSSSLYVKMLTDR